MSTLNLFASLSLDEEEQFLDTSEKDFQVTTGQVKDTQGKKRVVNEETKENDTEEKNQQSTHSIKDTPLLYPREYLLKLYRDDYKLPQDWVPHALVTTSESLKPIIFQTHFNEERGAFERSGSGRVRGRGRGGYTGDRTHHGSNRVGAVTSASGNGVSDSHRFSQKQSWLVDNNSKLVGSLSDLKRNRGNAEKTWKGNNHKSDKSEEKKNQPIGNFPKNKDISYNLNEWSWISSCKQWYYIDASKKTRGPWKPQQMNQWLNYFEPRLLISKNEGGPYFSIGQVFSGYKHNPFANETIQQVFDRLPDCQLKLFLKELSENPIRDQKVSISPKNDQTENLWNFTPQIKGESINLTEIFNLTQQVNFSQNNKTNVFNQQGNLFTPIYNHQNCSTQPSVYAPAQSPQFALPVQNQPFTSPISPNLQQPFASEPQASLKQQIGIHSQQNLQPPFNYQNQKKMQYNVETQNSPINVYSTQQQAYNSALGIAGGASYIQNNDKNQQFSGETKRKDIQQKLAQVKYEIYTDQQIANSQQKLLKTSEKTQQVPQNYQNPYSNTQNYVQLGASKNAKYQVQTPQYQSLSVNSQNFNVNQSLSVDQSLSVSQNFNQNFNTQYQILSSNDQNLSSNDQNLNQNLIANNQNLNQTLIANNQTLNQTLTANNQPSSSTVNGLSPQTSSPSQNFPIANMNISLVSNKHLSPSPKNSSASQITNYASSAESASNIESALDFGQLEIEPTCESEYTSCSWSKQSLATKKCWPDSKASVSNAWAPRGGADGRSEAATWPEATWAPQPPSQTISSIRQIQEEQALSNASVKEPTAPKNKVMDNLFIMNFRQPSPSEAREQAPTEASVLEKKESISSNNNPTTKKKSPTLFEIQKELRKEIELSSSQGETDRNKALAKKASPRWDSSDSKSSPLSKPQKPKSLLEIQQEELLALSENPAPKVAPPSKQHFSQWDLSSKKLTSNTVFASSDFPSLTSTFKKNQPQKSNSNSFGFWNDETDSQTSQIN